MLTTLRIENFALVKHLELDFSTGMTAFTGETGAGKSIVVDALMLALGERADASVVRCGEKKCDISATFQIEKDSEPTQWLADHDLDSEEDVILRRILYTEGRSKSYINGYLFTLQKVKELSELLVHVHCQHQHQTLLQQAMHRKQLDRFANHLELVNEVEGAYKDYQRIKQALETCSQQEKQRDRLDLLQFQIKELQAANLLDHEMQTLSAEHQLLHHAQDYLLQAQQMVQLLKGDEHATLCRGLHQILQWLDPFPKEHVMIKNTRELLNAALIQCEEACDEIKAFSEQIQVDPERLQAVEARLSTLHQLGRKYQVDPKQLPSHLLQLQKEWQSIQSSRDRMKTLQETYEIQKQAFESAAQKLHVSRKRHAKRLATELTVQIQQLGMPKGWVDVEVSPSEKPSFHGLDKVEYKVCTNPGLMPDSLSKIASGGELSRISLAIQMVTAQRGATPTLLFDEVDVGIGGATAALVGRLLRKLSERLQVICITHQPQVASCGHHHFVVEKHSSNDQTYSQVVSLNTQEQIDEIARMLGGITITEQTRSHAKELLEQSREESVL